jgi:predicted DNA-binding mobile mystery protein A
MTMQDLADRLGVIKQRVDRIEKDELGGNVTLKTLQETAEALNCDFVYFFVPKGEGLQKTLEEQALKAAREIVKSTEHTMELEEQGTSRDSQRRLVESIAQELVMKEDRRIWKVQNDSQNAKANSKQNSQPKPAGRNTSRR